MFNFLSIFDTSTAIVSKFRRFIPNGCPSTPIGRMQTYYNFLKFLVLFSALNGTRAKRVILRDEANRLSPPCDQ